MYVRTGTGSSTSSFGKISNRLNSDLSNVQSKLNTSGNVVAVTGSAPVKSTQGAEYNLSSYNFKRIYVYLFVGNSITSEIKANICIPYKHPFSNSPYYLLQHDTQYVQFRYYSNNKIVITAVSGTISYIGIVGEY